MCTITLATVVFKSNCNILIISSRCTYKCNNEEEVEGEKEEREQIEARKIE